MTTTQPMRQVGPSQPKTHTSRSTPSRWRRRTRNYFRSVFVRGDFSSLLITWALMFVTALALKTAGWAPGLGTLTSVSLFAVGFGFLLARSHYSELLALILSTTYGTAIIILASALILTESGALWTRTDTLLSELGSWFRQATSGTEPEHDGTAFVVFLSILFWYLGHNAAWHVFRVDRVWRVIIPIGLVLITNQFYYQGEKALDAYLIAFVVLSLLLLIRSNIDSREYEWYIHRVNFPSHVRRTFFLAGTIIALVVMLAAWAAPTGPDDKSLDRVQELLTGDAVDKLADLWNRLFSSLEGHGIATTNYYGGDKLQLSGAIQLGDQPVMLVQAPFGARYYWRSTVFDTFDFNRAEWSHLRRIRAYTDSSGLEFNIGSSLPGARREVTQDFTMLIRATKLVHAAPQPVQMGLPVEAELDCVNDLNSRTCVNDREPADVAIIEARETLRAGDSYSAVSSVSAASGDMLRVAGQDYPAWVQRLYLQGVDRLSPRVRDLANQIVLSSNAQTPYDKARAIEFWLRTNIQYNEAIPTPPRNTDYIEWFLFDQKEGYCNYYATAMIFMLRSQGIPARMAAGFAQGTWDPAQNAFLVRERDAHTWVEVYFPGYGWIEFEPTADEAPIAREDDEPPQTILPTLTPFPSPTPLPTVTPTPLPQPDNGANATPTSPAEAPFTMPTPTPKPSSTPPPQPDITRINGEGNPSILRIILLTLAVFALVIVIFVLVLVFLIWYIEYRGLGGLNVVQRAYARIGIYSRWLGVRFDETSTPDERRRYLVSEIPDGEQSINAITQTYIEDRYAKPETLEFRQAKARLAETAWQQVRSIFIRRKFARFFGRETPSRRQKPR